MEAKGHLFKWKHYLAEKITINSRDIHASKCFFKKALSSPHNQSPLVITVGLNPYFVAPKKLKPQKAGPLGISQGSLLFNISMRVYIVLECYWAPCVA
jgi:hypothetical protein